MVVYGKAKKEEYKMDDAKLRETIEFIYEDAELNFRNACETKDGEKIRAYEAIIKHADRRLAELGEE